MRLTPMRGGTAGALRPLLTANTVVLLLCTACAPRYSTAALGQYDVFQPFITSSLSGSVQMERFYDVELARPGYVGLIAITPPAGGHDDRPVVYDVLYPRYDTDRLNFPAGRSRLLPRRTTALLDPRNCSTEQKPTLTGCRRASRLLPGLSSGRPPGAPSHYLLIAADEFVDPFEVADELFFLTIEQQPLNRALIAADAETAAALIERALLDRRGTPVWAALYVVTH